MISLQQLLPAAGRTYRATRPGQHHLPPAHQLTSVQHCPVWAAAARGFCCCSLAAHSHGPGNCLMGTNCIISHNAPAKRKAQNSLLDAFSRALSSCRSPIALHAPVQRAANHIAGTVSPPRGTEPFSDFHFGEIRACPGLPSVIL